MLEFDPRPNVLRFLAACFLLACSQTESQAPVAQSPDPEPLVELKQGDLYLDGVLLCALHKPGVLRASRHRRLQKALLARDRPGTSLEDIDLSKVPEPDLAGSRRVVRLVVPPDTPYSDLYPVILTSVWSGYGAFDLSTDADSREPRERTGRELSMDILSPPFWSGEPIQGFSPDVRIYVYPERIRAWSRFLLLSSQDGGTMLRLPSQMLSGPSSQPSNCGSFFEGRQNLQGICEAAFSSRISYPPLGTLAQALEGVPSVPSVGAGLELGVDGSCLVGKPGDPEKVAQFWRQAVFKAMEKLLPEQGARVVVRVDKRVLASQFLETMAGLEDAGVRPLLDSQKPRELASEPCTAMITSGQELEAAAARWVGERVLGGNRR